MTLSEILELEAKNKEQKLNTELKRAREKSKVDAMLLCANLISQQITLNALALVSAK